MQVALGNERQSELWENAGPDWIALESQLDANFAEHTSRAFEAAAPRPGERVLDIGCGTGTTSLRLAQLVAPDGEVVGIDISPTMAEAAQQHAVDAGVANTSFIVADAQEHEFDQPFDLVFSRFGVMFFADPVQAFRNIRGCMRSGGRFVFACWQSPTENPSMSEPVAAVRQHIEIPIGGDPTAPGPFSLADPKHLRAILTAAGYEQIELESSHQRVHLGTTLEEAADFRYRSMPATSGLDESAPELAAAVRSSIADVFREQLGPDGVTSDSATWVVHAVAP